MMLISPEYRELNATKHKTSECYGTSGHKHVGIVAEISNVYGIKTILDYGCGKAELKNSFPPDRQDNIQCYDPCIEEYASRPNPAELVVCTDVMEHIEPEYLENVLADIASLTERYAYLNISLVEARKHLPDGRNAHLIVQPWQWWVEKFRPHFLLIDAEVNPISLNILCRSKNIQLC